MLCVTRILLAGCISLEFQWLKRLVPNGTKPLFCCMAFQSHKHHGDWNHLHIDDLFHNFSIHQHKCIPYCSFVMGIPWCPVMGSHIIRSSLNGAWLSMNYSGCINSRNNFTNYDNETGVTYDFACQPLFMGQIFLMNKDNIHQTVSMLSYDVANMT